MKALQEQFIQEARELLEGIGESLLKFEKDATDSDNLNNLFRLVHTLKGNTGLFEELGAVGRVLHAAEDTLDMVREGRVQLTSQDSDLLLDAMDFVSSSLDDWELERYDAERVEQQAHSLSLAIRAQAESPDVEGSINAFVSGGDSAVNAPLGASWIDFLLDHIESGEGQRVLLRYQPEPECFFKGEDPFQLARSVPELIGIWIHPVGQWPSLAQLDVYQAQIEIRLVSAAELSQVMQVFECIPEQVEMQVLPAALGRAHCLPPDCSTLSVETLEPVIPAHRLPAAQMVWKAQTRVLQLLDEQAPWQGRAQSVCQAIEGLSQSLGQAHWASAVRAATEASLVQNSPQPLLAWLQRPPQSLFPNHDSLTESPLPVAHAIDDDIKDELTYVQQVQTKVPLQRSDVQDHDHKSNSTLKVSREKVDRLMDLIGEMVVAKNALPYLAERAESQFGVRELSRELKTHYSVINRIAEEMQDAIMQVRMLPVGSVFQRFPRLVRDLSKKLGKKVRLEISGEETEADKNMIEALADPLIHLIRNSLDHGVEPPEDRLAAGKSDEGLIQIQAWQEGDRVIIRIADDGSGIDAERVRAKALDKGLLSEDKLLSMSESEVQQLIFMPGFSTASVVSDVSGRGVGMDVVRSAISRISGQIELKSEKGNGTEVLLSLPLTMAVTNVMKISSAGQSFGVPMDAVVETVRVSQSSIHQIQAQQATVLRGKIVPLLQLNRLLGLDRGQVANEADEFAVLVVKVGHETLGIVVDDFESTVDILLRPLEGVLAALPQYSGSALLGDGSVLLILNLAEVMSCQLH